MDTSLTLRAGTHHDHATLVDFQIRMARETEDLALDPDTVGAGVRAVLDDPTRGSYLLAEREGRVVGGLLHLPEWSDWRNATVLWIHSVFVVPEARRSGVFRALYGYLRELVERDPGYAGLRLYVDRTNTRAMRVYEELGMDGSHYALYEWLRD